MLLRESQENIHLQYHSMRKIHMYVGPHSSNLCCSTVNCTYNNSDLLLRVPLSLFIWNF